MNTVDIVILLILLFAAYRGVREGLIIQGLSIIGVALGIWFASSHGEAVATILGIKSAYASIWGFVIVVIAVVVIVAIAARFIRLLLKFVGFGLLDVILGGALSVIKFLVVLSVIFSAFDVVNHAYNIVDHKHIEQSKLYRPIANVSTMITPAWKWTQDQLNI